MRTVVAVRAGDGRIRVAFSDADGELPDEEKLARITDQVRAMAMEIVGRPIDVEVKVRPWKPCDGVDLVDWRSALRRWAAR